MRFCQILLGPSRLSGRPTDNHRHTSLSMTKVPVGPQLELPSRNTLHFPTTPCDAWPLGCPLQASILTFEMNLTRTFERNKLSKPHPLRQVTSLGKRSLRQTR